MAETYVDENGYERYSDSGNFVHRHQAKKRVGGNLWPGAVVHHINRDKTDNRPSNLWVFPTQKQHDNAHYQDAKRYGSSYSYHGRKKKSFS